MKKITLLITGMALCFTSLTQGQTIYTDFSTGGTGKKHADGVADSLGNFWSNVTAINAANVDLVTTANAATGIQLTMSGAWAATIDSSSPTPIASLGPNANSAFAYQNVIDDGIYMSNGASDVATITLTGLNDLASYNFYFLGSFGRTDQRWATFTIGAASTQVMVSSTLSSSDGIKNYNDNTIVSILGAVSNSGTLVINMTGQSGATGTSNGAFAIINAMGFTQVPEPTSLALLALGGLSLFGFRRRK